LGISIAISRLWLRFNIFAAGRIQVTRMGGELAPRKVMPLAISAAIIALTQLAMLALAPALADEVTAPPLPIFLYVALAVLGGAAWFAALGPLERLPMRPLVLLGVFVFGPPLVHHATRAGYGCAALSLGWGAGRAWDLTLGRTPGSGPAAGAWRGGGSAVG